MVVTVGGFGVGGGVGLGVGVGSGVSEPMGWNDPSDTCATARSSARLFAMVYPAPFRSSTSGSSPNNVTLASRWT